MIGKSEKVLALIASFVFFPVGVVFFIIWFGDENPEKRRLGKQCMIISLLPFLFFLSLVIVGILNFSAAPAHSGSSEEAYHEYTFNGEGEYWKAEYSFSGTEIWEEEEDGIITYSSESNDEFVLTYKGDLNELASLKSIEYSYETSIFGVGGAEEFDEPPTDVTFRISGNSTGAMISEDEVIRVSVRWDDYEESFELHNTSE